MKFVNIKLWDILGCLHYILNAPRTMMAILLFYFFCNSYLNDNQIVYLNKTDFEALYRLRSLYLQDNNIRDDTMEKGALGNCSSLTYL